MPRCVTRARRIVVSLLMQLRPSDSDATVEMQITHLWTMRDGTPISCKVYLRRDEALEAAEHPGME
jgi:ribosomal protein L5